MIPPSFSDLGKATRDLFDKKFKFGLLGIECTTSKDPITLKIEGTHDLKTKALVGSVETKHKGIHDIDVTTKWLTKNVLTSEVSKSSSWLKGLKSTAVFSFEPESGNKSLKIKKNYKRDLVNFNSEFFFASLKPVVNLNIVLGCTEPRGYLAGADVTVNCNSCSITKHILALSYQKRDFTVVGSMQGGELFSSQLHQKVSDHSEVGVSVSFNRHTKELKYGLAGQYNFPHSDHDSFIKAKVDHHSHIGLAYGTTVGEGVQLSICGEIDARNFEAGPHNIGLGLVYEP